MDRPGGAECHCRGTTPGRDRRADRRRRHGADRRQRGPAAGHRALGSRTAGPGRRAGGGTRPGVACRWPDRTTLEPVAPRVAVLPEHHTGWTGRPGLRGSFAGRGWSPAFTTTAVTLDGDAVSGFAAVRPGRRWRSRPPTTTPAGPAARPRAAAQRPAPRPGRRSPTPRPTCTRSTTWCWRSRCRPRRTNCSTSPGGTTASGCRSGPARHRHPPAGEPQGPDRRGQRLRAARRHRRVRLRDRRGLGACTPRGAATTSTTPSGSSPASRCSAAASCCCPARCGSATGESYREPVDLRLVRRRARRGGPPVPPAPARPRARRSRPTAR